MMFYRVNGLSIQGSGVINGRGQKWWNLPCKPHKGLNGTTQTGPCDSPVVSHRLRITLFLVMKKLVNYIC